MDRPVGDWVSTIVAIHHRTTAFILTYLHAYTQAYIHDTHACMHTYIRIYIYIYIYIYIHTHTYIRTYVRRMQNSDFCTKTMYNLRTLYRCESVFILIVVYLA
jgi:hypothetical protein